jgi:hypothetical protein
MKILLSTILAIASLPCLAQKYQTTVLDNIAIPDSLYVQEVSSDTALTKICFTASDGKKHKTYFLISERHHANWTNPYVALALPSSSMHARLSADGNQIFFVKDIDEYTGPNVKEVSPGVTASMLQMGIYASELIAEKTWSKPHLLDDYFVFNGPPHSLSISPSGKNLIFANLLIGKKEKRELLSYSCLKNQQNKWVEAGRLDIKGLVLAKKVKENGTAAGMIFHQNDSTILINAYDGSYLARCDGRKVGSPRKIEYYGGQLNWINPSGSTAISFTARPFKVSLVHLRPPKVRPLSAIPVAVSEPRESKVASTEEARTVKPTGKYFALLIGVSAYEKNDLNLERPIKDVEALQTLLTTRYLFDAENVQSLINPTRQQIINLLFKLRGRIGPNDNLLIFYAGHGYYDQAIRQGYWWPKDASPEDPSNWLSNSDLREQIRGIPSAHTLLISDACFSGGIFRTRGVEELRTAPREIILLYRSPSRRAITSGNLSSVPDHSVFFEYLVKRLTENPEKYLPSQQLFALLKPAVMNNSNTVPQDGIITDAGDEGGDFIFIKR